MSTAKVTDRAVNSFRCHWQAHWTSEHDAGNGPLRASGYGSSPEEAWGKMIGQMQAWLPHWEEDHAEATRAVDDVRQALSG